MDVKDIILKLTSREIIELIELCEEELIDRDLDYSNYYQDQDTIMDLDISVRAYTALTGMGIHSIYLLAACTREDLNAIRNMGKISVDNIIDALRHKQVYLKHKVPIRIYQKRRLRSHA